MQSTPIHYLDHACLGRPSRTTVAAVQQAMEQLAGFDSPGTQQTVRLFEAVDEARRRIAALVNADLANILLIENTTRGMGLMASALPLSPGDNVLVGDMEFLSGTVIWRAVNRRLGVEVRPVKNVFGRVLAQQFAAAADTHTRAIVVSSVQESNGYCINISEFQELAQALGAFLVVDGIQEVGALPVDLGKELVDAYCAGGHKWLRSPFGLGFLYVHPRLLERLAPPSFGYMALGEPQEGWDRYLQSPERTPFDPIPERTDARRLEAGGVPNWFGAIALAQSVAELLEAGQAAIWGRICSLRGRLLAGLSRLDSIVFSGSAFGWSADNYSGIVSVTLQGGLEAERTLLRRLTEARVYVSLRHISGVGGIRVAMHHDNTPDDIDTFLSVTREFLSRPSASVG